MNDPRARSLPDAGASAPRRALSPTPLHGLKRRILDEFRQWLEELDEDALLGAVSADHPEETPDLFSFLAELAALRRDVQLQAKESQTLNRRITETTENLAGQLAEQIRTLEHTVSGMREQLPRTRREAQTAVVLEFIAVFEGLERCRGTLLENPLPTILSPGRKARLRERLHRPVELLAAKADDALRRLGIEPVAAVGERFDPGCMRALERVNAADGDGTATVTAVLSQGYRLQGQLIKTAEVKVAT